LRFKICPQCNCKGCKNHDIELANKKIQLFKYNRDMLIFYFGSQKLYEKLALEANNKSITLHHLYYSKSHERKSVYLSWAEARIPCEIVVIIK